MMKHAKLLVESPPRPKGSRKSRMMKHAKLLVESPCDQN